jgi:hypothetical protein
VWWLNQRVRVPSRLGWLEELVLFSFSLLLIADASRPGDER